MSGGSSAAATAGAKTATAPAKDAAAKEKAKPATVVATAPQAAAAAITPDASAASSKCRVWQASYGGAKAVIVDRDEAASHALADELRQRDADRQVDAIAARNEVLEFGNYSHDEVRRPRRSAAHAAPCRS